MAIPELERRRAEAVLAKFSERVPPHIRRELSYGFSVRGNSITLFERRPYFQDRSRYTESPFARFVFDPTANVWSLRWRDRRIRWHAYEGFQQVRRFSDLIAEVERDPTHIFFG